MIHLKDLIITVENQNDFKKLTKCGNIYLGENAKLDAPALTTSGNIYLRENAKLDAPALTTSGNIYLGENAKLDAPALTTSGNIYLGENAKLDAPALTTSGNIYLRENAKLDAPALTTSGYIDLGENAKLDAPALTTSGYIYLRENAKLDAPALTTSGNIYLRENAKLDAPALTTSGYIYLGENAKLDAPFTKNLKYKAIDNRFFVIESEKTSKGIKIYSGYNLNRIKNGVLDKTVCFVAEKEGFYAHGESVKKAINDLQFKIVSERLKNEPINEDTVIDIQRYRLITGACEMGVMEFMKSHGLVKTEYTAKEIYPILKKHNAYGLSRLESLLTFLNK